MRSVALIRFPPACAFASLLLLGPAARAQTEQRVIAELEWRRDPGAEGCIERQALIEAVEARLSRNVFEGDGEIRVAGRIGPGRAGGWQARLTLATAKGQALGKRELTTPAADCSALDDSLALVVALMVDVPVSEVRARDEAAERKRAELAPTPSPTPLAIPRKTHAPRAAWSWDVSVQATAAVGLLPGIAPGVRAGLGVMPPAPKFELEFSYFFETRAEAGASGSAFSLLAVGLHVCPLELPVGAALVRGCIGQQAGWISADGFGYDNNFQRDRFVYGIELGARFEMPVAGPISLRAGARAQAPLTRHRFFATESDGGQTELYRVEIIAVAADLGFGLKF
jgi:hypothetical protein